MGKQKASNQSAAKCTNYTNLDIAKFGMALLVILIHARPFEGSAPIANFLVSDVIARVAVPVFFTISGFLFFRKLEYTDGKVKCCHANLQQLFCYIKRNSLVYFLWSGVYILFRLPSWYKIGWWGIPAVKDCIASLFFSGSYNHTWFLLSMLYAVPLLFGLLTICPRKKLPLVIAMGWAAECLLYSYGWIVPHDPQPIVWLMDKIPIAFDAAFRALPLLGVGVMLIDCDGGDHNPLNGLILVISLIFCAAEATTLKLFSPNQTNFSYLISTPCMAYFMLRYLLTKRQIEITSQTAAILRESSLIIYCLHPMVIQILADLGLGSGTMRSIAVMVISVIVSLIWSYFRKKRRGTKR